MSIDLARAKRRIAAIKDRMGENWNRMKEDMKFSNPADPEQWDTDALNARRASKPGECNRPCLVFDRTNQYIHQVVNDARMNKPAMTCLPVDDAADVKVAEKYNGILRHIEYQSRAGISYDTAIDLAARAGLGWLRVVPKLINAETGEQELRIERLISFDSAGLDPNSTEPDGQDAMYGYVEGGFVDRESLRSQYPGKRLNGKDEDWYKTESGQDKSRVCEYFEVETTKRKRKRTAKGDVKWDDEYDAETDGESTGEWDEDSRKVWWCKISGGDILEESEFPSSKGQAWVPIVPVMGDETWIEGKRWLSGLTRRMRTAQQAYNYERTAYIEAVALQPRAPFIAAWEAIETFSEQWGNANVANQAFLPFNARDGEGNPLPMPQRQSPPILPASFIQGGQAALGDLEASVGIYRANLGAPSNETSGKAINARQREGDTSTFHYVDNLGRSIEQLGRIIVSAIPRVFDTKRIVRILNEDGSPDSVQIDPKLPKAVQVKDGKVTAINPGQGKYDVRVKVGPAFTTLRQEAAQNVADMARGNPQIAAALGPFLARMQDWPEQDKVARVLMAMLPPQVQQAYNDGNADIPPAVQAQMMAMQQQNQQLQQALQQATAAASGEQQKAQLGQQELQLKQMEAMGKAQAEQAKLQQNQAELALKSREADQRDRELEISAFEAETARLTAVAAARASMQPPEPKAAPELAGGPVVQGMTELGEALEAEALETLATNLFQQPQPQPMYP